VKKPRLILADDHVLFVEGLKKLLEPEFELAGTVEDGRALIEMATQLRPDAVILDISMPSLNGLEAARMLRSKVPQVRILFLSMHTSPDHMREAFRAGASGYLSKSSAASELVKALREVLRGHQYVSLQGVSTGPMSTTTRRGASELFRDLTPRQREVLQLVAEGKSAKMIAGILSISPKTVEFHKASMLESLRLQTTAELIRYAIERGLVGAPEFTHLP
jgi:DNA-binding NarL/FixJ family response regulator